MSDYPGFQKMLDNVEWKEMKGMPAEAEDGLPYATHEGILKIGDFEFKVYQLNDGQRIIAQEDLDRFFDPLD